MQYQEFTAEQFEKTDPFEYAYQFNKNKFQLEKILHNLSVQAKKNGINNFKSLYKAYVVGQKEEKNVKTGNVTDFTGQPSEMITGKWKADDGGVSCFDADGVELFACEHPITITERLTSIDTGIEKLKLNYSRAYRWRNVIVPKSTIANSRKIIELSDLGIGVTSENARLLVTYLHDLENENYADIPEKKCCGRLGWIDEEGFAPYCGHLEFDGDPNLQGSFSSIKECGSYDTWLELARKSRKFNVVTKIMLAASFASVLVKPLGGLVFFVHMWGGTEVGKTVGLMLASSVWASPELGKYIQSFNSTVVGRERMAAFYNNMPLIMDELQVIKDKKSFDHDIYTLTEGAGKTRGNKNGGTDITPTWANCILSNGEMPITNSGSGGGAVNRILEIECKEALFQNPAEACEIMRKNYGHAGKKFIEALQRDGMIAEAQLIYKKFYDQLSKNDTTQKQAMAGALVLTADEIISGLFFDDTALTADDIKGFLQSKKDVSANERGYDYLCNWVSQNSNRFRAESQDIYGKIEGDMAYILANVFTEACNSGGYNDTALRSFLKDNGKIIADNGRTTKKSRINGISSWCVCLVLNDCPF